MKASALIYLLQSFINKYGDSDIRLVRDEQGDLSINLRKVCKDCEANFDITQKDRDSFERNGWSLPIRCKPCRKNRNQHSAFYSGLRETMNNNDKMRRNTKPRSNASKNYDGFRM